MPMPTRMRSIDTSLIVAGAKLDLNQGSIEYTRYFGFVHV